LSTTIRPFLFETSFDEDANERERKKREAAERAKLEAEAAANAEPPPPTFTEEELAAARQAGFLEGRNTGISEAQASHERRSADALDQVSRALGQLDRAQREGIVELMRGALEVTHTIVRKVLPDYVRRHGSDEIQALVRQVLETLIEEPRVVIRVPQDLIDTLKPRIAQAGKATSFEGQLVVFGEPTLGDSDCRVEWSSGGAERLVQQSLDQIAAVVGQAQVPPDAAPDDSSQPVLANP
jgi:flagellar assembly protein FliH